MQGLKMTDGLYSLIVCNDSMIGVHSSHPYRSYELLTVEVRRHSIMQVAVYLMQVTKHSIAPGVI